MKKLAKFLFLVICIKLVVAADNGIDLSQIVTKLNDIANPSFAVDWDNVGLQIEPSKNPLWINKVMLANELNNQVLDEAIRKGAQLIITYHPVIDKTAPLTTITQAQWTPRLIIKCIEHGIAVYSPHTAWDSFNGGINDWILNLFNFSSVEAIQPVRDFQPLTGYDVDIRVDLTESVENNTVFRRLMRNKEIKFMGEMDLFKGYASTSSGLVEAEFMATQQGFMDIVDTIRKHQPSALKTLRSTRLEKPVMKSAGLGRRVTLVAPESVHSVAQRLKQALKRKHLRVALGDGKTLDSMVNTMLVAAGTTRDAWWKYGKSVDLLICSEMSSHELTQSVRDGITVIMTEHNAETSFLDAFKTFFQKELSELNKNSHVDLFVSEIEHDPVMFF